MPSIAAIAEAQKTLPTTAASCTIAFSSGPSPSSRAAMTAWTDSGSGSSARGSSRPRSASIRTYSTA